MIPEAFNWETEMSAFSKSKIQKILIFSLWNHIFTNLQYLHMAASIYFLYLIFCNIQIYHDKRPWILAQVRLMLDKKEWYQTKKCNTKTVVKQQVPCPSFKLSLLSLRFSIVLDLTELLQLCALLLNTLFLQVTHSVLTFAIKLLRWEMQLILKLQSCYS